MLRLLQIGLLAAFMLIAPSLWAQSSHPTDNWEFGVEMGYLKKVKHNSPYNYVIAPTQFIWRTPAHFDLWRSDQGARLTMRHRLSIVVESILRGPEDYYLALDAAPVFELWSADQKTALFYEIGGGSGYINSKNVPGGQGQNFTFNWFTQFGVRRQIEKKLAVTGGVYFTHHSNLGMTNPNPGIDVLGVNFGLVWTH